MTELNTKTKLAGKETLVERGYLNGATLKELGDLYGVSQGTIRNCLIHQGVSIRRRGRRKQQEANNGTNESFSEPNTVSGETEVRQGDFS